jgi:hypothetical protein
MKTERKLEKTLASQWMLNSARSDIAHYKTEFRQSQAWEPHVCPPWSGILYSGLHSLALCVPGSTKHSPRGEFSGRTWQVRWWSRFYPWVWPWALEGHRSQSKEARTKYLLWGPGGGNDAAQKHLDIFVHKLSTVLLLASLFTSLPLVGPLSVSWCPQYSNSDITLMSMSNASLSPLSWLALLRH